MKKVVEKPRRTKSTIKLVGIYRRAAADLVSIIQNSGSLRFKKARVAQLQKIMAVMKRLDKNTKSWIRKNIPKEYRESKKKAVEAIVALKEDGFKVPVAGVNEKMVESLVSEAENFFGKAIKGVGASAESALNEIARAEIARSAISKAAAGASTEAVKKDILENLKKKGWTAVQGPKRKFGLLDYVDIVARSQIAMAQNEAIEQGFFDAGRRFGRVDTIRPDIDGDDICNRYEGKIIDLIAATRPSVNVPNPKNKKPPFHARCRHSIDPVSFAQIKKEAPELLESALKFYEEASGVVAPADYVQNS